MRPDDPALDAVFGPRGPRLTVQLTYGVDGCSLVNEALCTLPPGAGGQPDLPRLEARPAQTRRPPDARSAGELLFDVVCRDPAHFGRARARSWRRQMVQWLGASGIPAARLRAIADAAGDEHFVFAID